MRSRILALVCSIVLSASTLAAQPLICSPIDGIEKVLNTPGVFIGDQHGSVETPAFLGDLACHVMATGRPVVIAMEYSAEDQQVLDAFLKTSDEPAASRLLTGTPYWTTNRDGRASSAMRDALLTIRRNARAGGKVKLIAYDTKVDTWQQRDPASADLLIGRRNTDGAAAYWIVFGGNVHARKTRGLTGPGVPPEYAQHEHLGYLLRDWHLVHLNAAYRGGASWACTGAAPGNCSVHQHGQGCSTDCPPHTLIRLTNSDPAYDGVYDVGKLTPSPPLYLSANATAARVPE